MVGGADEFVGPVGYRSTADLFAGSAVDAPGCEFPECSEAVCWRRNRGSHRRDCETLWWISLLPDAHLLTMNWPDLGSKRQMLRERASLKRIEVAIGR